MSTTTDVRRDELVLREISRWKNEGGAILPDD